MENTEQGKKNNKNVIIGIIAAVLIVGLGSAFVFRGSTEQKTTEIPEEVEEEVIPTVDPSVQVTIEAINNNKELIFTVSNIPDGTESIEYELTYDTKQGKTEGLYSIIQLEENEGEIERTLTVGTCSSGTCVYHDLVGNIQATLKFSGSYGDRIFEKEYEL